MTDPKQRELGDFLRARRGRLTPESVGLPRRRPRRTPGLRREEVAERAGIGVDWYIRLEQGRPVTPSASTVDALARALQLTEPEHQHLRALAGGGGAGDPAFVALLGRLREGCPEFGGWWDRHDVRRPASGRKTFHHASKGVISFDHASFQANDDPGLKLVIYTPVPAGEAG